MAITKLDSSYCSYKVLIDTDLTSTPLQNFTNGAATVYSITVDNSSQNSATPSFLKLYDVLTDGGIVANSTEPNYIFQVDGAKKNVFSFPDGLTVANGLSMRCVASAQTNDTSAPGQDVTVTVVYK
jgi:hypothetical protein